MNPALFNLIIFFVLAGITWFAVRVVQNTNLLQGKNKREKDLTEDILKQLFHVEQSGRTATLSDLSGALKVRRSKILPIVEAASASHLLKYADDSLQLTDEGRDYALKIVRVHRLWEKYLAEKTGYNHLEWHYLAEKMEHKLTDEDTSRLSNTLGNPLYDPHGDPIPNEKGEIQEMNWQPLPAYPVGVPGKIVHIEDEPGVIYNQILEKKILIGSHFVVKESTNGHVVFECEGQEHRFSSIVAANINVSPLSAEEAYEENAVRLSALKEGEVAEVLGLSEECRGASRRRLLDLGILPGTKIEVDLRSPMRDPVAYRVRNTSIALRNTLSDLILINKMQEDGRD